MGLARVLLTGQHVSGAMILTDIIVGGPWWLFLQTQGFGGGGGGKIFDESILACNFFFKVKISSHAPNSTHFSQDQFTVAQRVETTVAGCSLTN